MIKLTRSSLLSLLLTSLISFSAAEEALTPKTQDPFAEDPSKKDPFAAGVAEQKKEVKRELFMINVIISNGEDEVGNFKAICSNQSDDMGLFCKGSIAINDTCQWRVMVHANLDDTKYADLEIVIDDLKAFTKSSEGIIQPMNVFTATQQCKGVGTYAVGELQGKTINVEISKAEQNTNQSVTRPE